MEEEVQIAVNSFVEEAFKDTKRYKAEVIEPTDGNYKKVLFKLHIKGRENNASCSFISFSLRTIWAVELWTINIFLIGSDVQPEDTGRIGCLIESQRKEEVGAFKNFTVYCEFAVVVGTSAKYFGMKWLSRELFVFNERVSFALPRPLCIRTFSRFCEPRKRITVPSRV